MQVFSKLGDCEGADGSVSCFVFVKWEWQLSKFGFWKVRVISGQNARPQLGTEAENSRRELDATWSEPAGLARVCQTFE